MIDRQLLHFVLASLAVVAGCAAKEELIAKSPVVPSGIELSGQWQLRDDNRDTVRRIGEAEVEAAGGRQSVVLVRDGGKSKSRRRSADATTVHVFLETGKSLKVTQTKYALFVSFDRAIVEEYRFGEKRMINVGPIVADRVSGWQSDHYIIETLAEDGGKLIETYRLAEDRSTLIRTITIFNDGEIQLDIQQVFDRV
jgi:hypothetical protein